MSGKRSAFLTLCFVLAVAFIMGAPASAQVTDQSLSLGAHAKYDVGQLDEAESLFLKLLQQFPSSGLASDAQYYLGWIAYKKQTGEAEPRWQAVVDRYPTSPEAPKALMSIAAVHYKAGASKESRIAEFQRIISLYPQSPEAEEARFRVGVLYNRAPPDFDKALRTLEEVATGASNPKWKAEAYVEIGMTHLQRYFNQGRKNPDDFTEAVKRFQSARATFPDQADAVARGELRLAKHYLYSERDPAKARQALNDILAAYPETRFTTEILYQIAYCKFEEKDYLACIQLCEDILVGRPASDWNCYLQYFIGNCYLQAGRKADAVDALRKTVSLYPGTNWARIAESTLKIVNREEAAQ